MTHSAVVRTELFGRTAERSRLQQVLDDIAAQRSTVLLVEGDPGVGKTALLQDLKQRCEGAATVLTSRGVEPEAAIAFSALSQLLRPLLTHLDGVPPRHAELLAGAMGIGPPAGGDAFDVGAATLNLMATAAEQRPVLALIDDVHLVDESSARALTFAARRFQREGIAVVVAARPDHATPFRDAVSDVLHVHGLAPKAVTRLLQRHARVAVAESVVDRIHADCQGSPLAIIELCATLDDDQLAGRVPLPDPLPVTRGVEAAFRNRLNRLPESTRAGLVVVAAGGEESRIVLAALHVLELGVDVLEPAEDGLIVTVGEGRIAFRHPLVRSLAYHSASPAMKRRAHAALAHALRGTDQIDLHLVHRAAAATGEDESLARALEQSAVRIRARAGYGESAVAFEKAARFTPDREARARRLVRAADAAQMSGQLQRANALYEEALDLTTDEIVRADVQHRRGQLGLWGPNPLAAHDLLVSEAARVQPRDPVQASLMLIDASIESALGGYPPKGLQLANRARQLAQVDDPTLRSVADAVLGGMLVLNGREHEGRELLCGCAPHLVTLDPMSLVMRQGPWIALTLSWVDEIETARALLDRTIDTARSWNAAASLCLPLAVRSAIALDTGRLAAAVADATSAWELSEQLGLRALVPYALLCVARCDARQGRVTQARRRLDQVAAQAGQLGLLSINYRRCATLGELELSEGNPSAAAEWLEQVRELAAFLNMTCPLVAWWHADLVEAYFWEGKVHDAATALVEFESVSARVDHPEIHAQSARAQALLAPTRDVDDAFGAALQAHAVARDPFARARTSLAYGMRLRRLKRRSAAAEHLRAALTAFDVLGAERWSARATAELKAAGEHVRGHAVAVTAELTAQELQVARLVAEGASNKEAAAALFLSPKTIEYHLGNVYRKLGVRSRAQLARRFAADSHTPSDP